MCVCLFFVFLKIFFLFVCVYSGYAIEFFSSLLKVIACALRILNSTDNYFLLFSCVCVFFFSCVCVCMCLFLSL